MGSENHSLGEYSPEKHPILVVLGVLSILVSMAGTAWAMKTAYDANNLVRISQHADISVIYLQTYADYAEETALPCMDGIGIHWKVEFIPVFSITNNGSKSVTLNAMRYGSSILDPQYQTNTQLAAYANYRMMKKGDLEIWTRSNSGPGNSWIADNINSFGDIDPASPHQWLKIIPGDTFYVALRGNEELHFFGMDSDQVGGLLRNMRMSSTITFIFSNSNAVSVAIPTKNPNEDWPGYIPPALSECPPNY